MKLVSSRKPFGLATNVQVASAKPFAKSLTIYQIGGVGYIDKAAVTSGD